MVQRPVTPGETFTYRFRLPDAGTFWYHPHLNETIQPERGLYGAIVVRAPEELRLDAERVLIFDDVQLDAKAQIKPPGWWLESHNGREGSTRLVNGRQEPELTMAGGQIERWRIVNAASARYIRLSLGGRPFSLLGTDGGLIASPIRMTEVLLAPADRVRSRLVPSLKVRRSRLSRWGTSAVGSVENRRQNFSVGSAWVPPLVPAPLFQTCYDRWRATPHWPDHTHPRSPPRLEAQPEAWCGLHDQPRITSPR